MTPVWFVLAAAIGAVARYSMARFVCSWQAVLVVNTVGAAILGFLGGRDAGPAIATVIGVGFCGALTTFGSFALVVRELGPRLGSVYAVSTMVSVCGAASLASTF